MLKAANEIETTKGPGAEVQPRARQLIDAVEQVIVGKRDTVTLVVVALLCEGHVALEDIPGMGKTLLARTVARCIDGEFRRIQFTPDLLPSDVTGLNVFDQQRGEFKFRPGPLLGNIILADEINRATPRTQSCLLEAMEERQVTVDDRSHPLPRPFLVIATQNPIEQEGTFPLPEAQLDRFLITLSHGYPSEEEEEEIVLRFQRSSPLEELEPVITGDDLMRLQQLCRQVKVEESVRRYIVRLVRATRGFPGIHLGASPRATQRLHSAAQALAAVRGRDYVVPDDAKDLAVPVLAHRIVVGAEARLKGENRKSLIEAAVRSVKVPVD
ncbi:MAG: MoxR family ATPase [Mesorhizobium sp.]|nr:MoxR family ATPase [Mesorhizobium sp.]